MTIYKFLKCQRCGKGSHVRVEFVFLKLVFPLCAACSFEFKHKVIGRELHNELFKVTHLEKQKKE